MPVILDPDAAAVYKAFQEAGRPAYETLTPPEAREFYNQARFVSNPEPPELESAKDISIPAAHGAIPARLYTPKEFVELKTEALKMGFRHVESGPLVRSSYHAHEQAASTGLRVLA